jgi:hypothetical protein
MPRPFLLAALLLGACAPGTLGSLASQSQRRGEVEVAVKGAHPAIVGEIDRGGGPALTRAFDAAGVPPSERATRVAQLDGDLGLYAANPGALVAALLVFGS